MKDFMLIDLHQQRYAVTAYVQGWTKDEILKWMRGYGTIYFAEEVSTADWEHYVFHSWVSWWLYTPFFFRTGNEKLFFTPFWG